MGRRKGSILLDTVSVLLIVLVIASVAITLLFVVGEMEVASQGVLTTTYFDDARAALGVVEYGVIFLVGGFYLVSVISALLIPTNPIFLVPSLISMGVATWLSSKFSNLFWLIARTDVLRSAVNEFPIVVTFFERLPWIIGGFTALMVIVMFFNPGGGGGSQEVTI